MTSLVDKGAYFECIIRSEEDAWALLELVSDESFEDKEVIPEFEGWPDLTFKYWRDGENRTLTAPMMEGLLDVQEAIYRAFLLVEQDTSNLRFLSDRQRETYELPFKIKSGSTEAKPDWNQIFKEFAQSAAKNMSGKQVTIVILAAVLTYGGSSAWAEYLDHKSQVAQAEASNRQVEQALEAYRASDEADLRRMELLRDIAASDRTTEALIETSEDAKDGIVRSAKRVDSTKVAGVEIPPGVAKRLARAPKAEIHNERTSSNFLILRNDATVDSGFRVRLRNLDTDEEFFATLRDRTIAPQDREIIQQAEWEKIPIRATVAIQRRRGEIVRAQIITAERA